MSKEEPWIPDRGRRPRKSNSENNRVGDDNGSISRAEGTRKFSPLTIKVAKPELGSQLIDSDVKLVSEDDPIQLDLSKYYSLEVKPTKDYQWKLELHRALRSSLKDVFDRAGNSDYERSQIVDHTISALIEKGLVSPIESGRASNQLEADAPTTPRVAPELYMGLRGPETPPEFVKRVYGFFLGQGLDRAHIRRLDPVLSQAIMNWSRKNAWPPDVDLPTRSEQNRRVVGAGPEAVREHLGKFTGVEAMREAARLQAISRRAK